MRILLISTYELGHQPLHVASPAAVLRQAGVEVRVADLAVDRLDHLDLDWADRVAISVPMHTAMRLGVRVAGVIRDHAPEMPVAFYGLYAGMGHDPSVGAVADVAFVGEYESALVSWCLDGTAAGVCTDLSVSAFTVPDRSGLPELSRYAHLRVHDDHRMVGYVEASHGCRHRCRHCPIPAVYDGVYRIVGQEPVIADIAQLVDIGAQHISFGDPDFLNGPAHSLRVIESAHDRFPDITFDVTIKVEHILRHSHMIPRLAAANTLYIVSAFETTHDPSLELLDKGHTVADMAEALATVRACGIEIHPSWMPFMPWTTPDHVADVFRFLDRHDLFGVTDPVQLSIRLLIPAGSLMLDVVEVGDYDPEALTYRWRSDAQRSDVLQQRLAALAAADADSGRPPIETLVDMWVATLEAAGMHSAEAQIPAGATSGRPRMTEPWFC